MWLLLTVVVLCASVAILTLWLGFFWVTSLAFVYFSLNYLVRRSHYTGYDGIDLLRALPLWRWISPVSVTCISEEALRAKPDDRFIFVVIPNATNTSLIWTFGLHGNAWPNASSLRLCYIMPDILFHIPVVRECLLWSGAVTCGTWDNGAAETMDSRVLEMTRLGRNVAYAPNGMEDALFVADEDKIHARRPGMSLFRLAHERKYHIVPCLCSGEHDRRYIFITSDWIRRVQRWMLQRIGYPLPLIFFPDVKQQQSRVIDVVMGEPIRADTPEALQRAFFQSLERLNNNGADKELILKD